MQDYPKLIADGASIEEVIQALRNDGLSKVLSIKALCDLDLAKLPDAKRLVHESQAWADVRQRDEAFWDELEESSKEANS